MGVCKGDSLVCNTFSMAVPIYVMSPEVGDWVEWFSWGNPKGPLLDWFSVLVH